MTLVTSNKDPFEARMVELADLAKALGHPARLRILEVLADSRSCFCGDIVDRLPLAQATVSQHLKELKRVGMIQGNIEGPRTCYCLDPAVLQRARRGLDHLFGKLVDDTTERMEAHDRINSEDR